MKINVPAPVSGGFLLSCKCSTKCRYCIYLCSPESDADRISGADLEKILSQLSGRIMSSPYGPKTTSLNHGLHFTGGETFLHFDLLCKSVEIAHDHCIPSTYVESNRIRRIRYQWKSSNS